MTTRVNGTIKPLVWDDLPSASIDLPLSYCIDEDEYGHWNVIETYREYSDLLDGGPFPTLEAAKAAAQADYEARILAQIEPDPEALCEDEGCPHHGTDHVCVNKSADDSGAPTTDSADEFNRGYIVACCNMETAP